MRTRISIAAAAAALVLACAPAVQAQQIVHDPRAFAQMIEEARTTLDQLRALQAQVEQGQQLLDSLNDLSGVNALASELGLPTVRNPLPDMRSLRPTAISPPLATWRTAPTRSVGRPASTRPRRATRTRRKPGIGTASNAPAPGPPATSPSAKRWAARRIAACRAWRRSAPPWTPRRTPAPSWISKRASRRNRP